MDFGLERSQPITAGSGPLVDMLRARPAWAGRRLILHGGAPKTGTTALQLYLDRHRTELAACGLLYPLEGVDDPTQPKHQWFNRHLYSQPREDLFAEQLAKSLDEGDGTTTTLILSTEGIFNHWWDYGAEPRRWLTLLSSHFDLKCLIWLREPVAFFKSLYVQYLKNPRAIEAYGRDVSPAEMLATSWVSRHLEYDALVADMAQVFGSENVFAFAYTTEIVTTFMSLFGLTVDSLSTRRENVTALSSSGVARLRALNRADYDAEKRASALADIMAMDARDPGQAAPFCLTPDVTSAVRKICPATVESLGAMDTDARLRWHRAYPSTAMAFPTKGATL